MNLAGCVQTQKQQTCRHNVLLGIARQSPRPNCLHVQIESLAIKVLDGRALTHGKPDTRRDVDLALNEQIDVGPHILSGKFVDALGSQRACRVPKSTFLGDPVRVYILRGMTP
jgi:hypothetical protein